MPCAICVMALLLGMVSITPILTFPRQGERDKRDLTFPIKQGRDFALTLVLPQRGDEMLHYSAVLSRSNFVSSTGEHESSI